MLEPKRAPAAPNAIASTEANSHASRVQRISLLPTSVTMNTTKPANATRTTAAAANPTAGTLPVFGALTGSVPTASSFLDRRANECSLPRATSSVNPSA